MNLIIDILVFIKDKLMSAATYIINRFMEINIFEKGIVINAIPAFFAVTMPMAGFYMMEINWPINNPLAVYMIGIIIVMIATQYLIGKYFFAARIGLNLYYLAWVIYLGVAREISKAPYEISAGYYINLLVPVIYAALAAGSYFAGDKA